MVLHATSSPVLLLVFFTVLRLHVRGRLAPLDIWQELMHWVLQMDWADVMPPMGVIEPPKIVMTTSATMSMTIAATTSSMVMFI
jgi:hypothetical protein